MSEVVPDDVMLNKAAVIERSLRRVLDIYRADPDLAGLMHVDALTLNVERAALFFELFGRFFYSTSSRDFGILQNGQPFDKIRPIRSGRMGRAG